MTEDEVKSLIKKEIVDGLRFEVKRGNDYGYGGESVKTTTVYVYFNDELITDISLD